MKRVLKRTIPNNDTIESRKKYLNELKYLEPSEPTNNIPSKLEIGNSKLGSSGRFFKSVFVWNMPAVSTCPGASNWCLSNCYNADQRSDKFNLNLWRENWWWVERDIQTLESSIIKQLNYAPHPCAVRIHSSGDFYSIRYVRFWYKIVNTYKNIKFWAYTRSWSSRKILPYLNELKELNNIQLFASYDETMSMEPPLGWRLCRVISDLSKEQAFLNASFESCPEQYGLVESCASCGFCINTGNKNILFIEH